MLQAAGLLAIGVLAGMASGFLGIGGGVILVPALVYGFQFTQHRAQGTTLATLVLPIGIFAAWNYFRSGFVDVPAALLICVGFAAGGLLGSHFALELPDRLLKRLFALLLFGLAARMLFSD